MENVISFVILNSDSEENSDSQKFYEEANAKIREALTNLVELRQQIVEISTSGFEEAVLNNSDHAVQLVKKIFFAWHCSSNEVLKVFSLVEIMGFFSEIKLFYYCLWDHADIDLYESLGNNLTVYRGGQMDGSVALSDGFSWSVKAAHAAYYSERKGNEFILRGTVEKKNILAVFNEEQEIVLLPGTVIEVCEVSIDEI